MIEENSRRSIFNRLFSYISILTAILSAAALITIVIADPTDEKYFNKDNLKKLITQAVKNGASIDNIKHIYDARLLEKKPFFSSKDEFAAENYTENTSLSFILQDLLSGYYTNSNFKTDSLYLYNLKTIIKENEETNPFDKLDIRLKTDSNYVKIQSDIIRITDELDSKNQLVNKYLNKSEISFNLSIIALIITILLSAYQIYQNYSSTKNVQKVISEIFEKNKKDKLKDS
ncbi:hypothetical protein ABH040_20800 [Bacteroides thetaiotaomicron]|uniref:hypothetical protein n=1 Tax=Bacteroides thetaiotaomicron TaxID=818 RepID=UPI0032618127